MTRLPKIPAGRVNLTRLYVDGMPLEDLQALYDYNTRTLGASKWNGPNQFWCSPPRNGSSRIREVLDVALGSPSRVNHFSFQISKFPCRMWLQWQDPQTHAWKPVRHKRNHRPIMVTINESVPKRIHPHTYDKAHRHPQHRAAGHWRTVEVDTKPVHASRFRLIIARINSPAVPVAIGTSKHTPYSIAVKDFQYGYEVKGRDDLPVLGFNTQIVENAPTFSTTTDLLGSAVEFGLTEYDANDILWPNLATLNGVRKGERDGDGEFWKSEPQPYPYAVVNLYVDARNAHGLGQSVDRFYIDTPTTGVGCNLYYSNSDLDVSQGFEARDTAIRYPSVQGHGGLVSDDNGILFPAIATTPSYLDFDLKAIQNNDSNPWWVGVKWQPQFDSTSLDEFVLISTPHIEIRWVDGEMVFDINGGSAIRGDLVFAFNQEMSLLITHTATAATIYFSDGWSTTVNYPEGTVRPGYETPAPLTSGGLTTDTSSAGLDRTRTLRFGATLADTFADLGVGGYRLVGFVIKQEEITDQGILDWMTLSSTDYLVPSDDSAEIQGDYTGNALVRITPFYRTAGVSSRNPYGVVGGPAAAYDSLTWTPINRDYRLQKGFLKFDPVKAKYFKFEFSNLSPQPYASYVPMSRRVRLFTADTITTSMGMRRQGTPILPAPIVVNMTSASTPLFNDQQRVQYLANPGRSYDGYTPVEALYSSDPNAQDRLATLNPAFRFQVWHRPSGIPRFVREQKHFYETVRVTHKSNVAYFVGLSDLRMYRVDYTASDDTDAYLIPFYDTTGLSEDDPSPWSVQEPNGLLAPSTPTAPAIRTTSLPLLSRRNVRGVQFATMQTPAIEVLADPDFNDPDLTYWTTYGGAQLAISSDLTSDIGTTVKVTRAPTSSYWDALEALGSWDDIEGLDPDPALPTWDDLESPPGSVQYGGLQGNLLSLHQPTPEGRIYAAARVYTPDALTAPLHLQIVGNEGNALAEAQIQPKAGGLTEWFTGYTLGTAITDLSNVPTWDEIEAEDASPVLPTWDDLEAQGSWNQVMGELTTVYDGPVTVRLFQQEPTHDVWYVDNLSLYEDPIVWEFSNDDGLTWWPGYDIRNNPNGVLLFPDQVPDTLAVNDNLNLMWRVTTYRSGMRIGGLFIRPWYSTLQLGVPVRDSLSHGGPNISHYDQYPSIADYAPFKAWDKPIPQDWWFNYRQWLLQGGIPGQQITTVPITPTVIPYLSDAFVVTAPALFGVVLGEAVVVLTDLPVLGEGIVL